VSFWKNERLRERAALASRLAGTLLVSLGLVLAYANRVVFDADAFADRAALSLGDLRVAGFVGERLADEVIAQNRDLVAVRPVLATVARSAVASEPFRVVFRQASRSAHALAFSKGAEKVVVSLPDFGVLMRGTLSQLRPDLADRVEARGEVLLVEDLDEAMGAGVLRALQLASQVREWTELALGLGILLLVGSVAFSRDRRRTLLSAGFGLTTAALLLLVLPTVLGGALTARIEDAGLRDAARGVWAAFSGGFSRWALLLGGMGIVLSAAASSLVSHVEVERAVLAAWRWLRDARGRPGAELLRAFSLLGVGALVFLHPAGTVDLIVAILGAILAFEGLRSLFGLIAPQLEERAGHAKEALAKEREREAQTARGFPAVFRWLRLGLVAVLSLGLLAAAISYLRSPASVPALRALVAACNGDVALCDRSLDEVVLPGAHNAMASADVPGWMFPNHEHGIPSQLQAGIRALLIDVHGGIPVAGRIKSDLEDEAGARREFEKIIGKEAVDAAMRIRDRLVGEPEGLRASYLCHGFCELGAQPLVPVLSGIRDFLVEHPGEVLVIVIEDYVAPEEIARAFEESGLLRLVYRGPAEPPWPTLREMISKDQRVLVLAEADSSGVPWYHQAFEVMQETPYHFTAPEEFSCAPNRGETTGSLFQVNHWIDTTPTPRPSNAETVNTREFLLGRARKCQAERAKLPNVLAVDFAMTGDVFGAAAELNGLN
jgi:hypothetical protein